MDNLAIGGKITKLRTKRDLTTTELAKMVGISQAQISQIEAGLSAPSLTTLFRLSKAVQVNMSQLFAGL